MNSKTLYDWLDLVVNMGKEEGEQTLIILANQSGPKASADCITWLPMSSVPKDYSYVDKVVNEDNEYNADIDIKRQFKTTVSVSAYSSNGASILQTLAQSNYITAVRQVLMEDHAVLKGCGVIRDLSTFTATKYTPRFQADFEFDESIQYVYEQPDFIFDSYSLTGEFKDPDSTVVIEGP